ncbi:hypothetical protein [Angustibacter aerolatus]
MQTDAAPATDQVDDVTAVEAAEPVDPADAMEAWAQVAHDELVETAKRYNAVITTKELGERVQEVSGARTTVLLQHWITKLLDAVATQAAAAGEPPLASLVVRPDGGAGAAYGRSARTAGDAAVADLDALAAQHRLLCYQAFAEDLPDGGGRVTLTPQVAARKERARAQVERPVNLCPVHYIALPVSGHCELCD